MVEGNNITTESTGLPYDAVLIISFGGPEGMDDVMPFLENVLRGRNVPRERLLEVGKHYELFGGVSPINEQNRKLISALKQELEDNGPRLPIYFGNRNWHPLLPDTIRQMRDDGVKRALGFVTSAYSSYASCRQYLENTENARESVGPDAPHVDKLRAFYNHPLFIEANVAQIRNALNHFPEPQRSAAHILFTAHSIPQSMAQGCDYEAQLRETSALIAESLGLENWRLVFQSRSGPATQPWLGPDVRDYLNELHGLGARDVVLAPIGFVSDHMEIIYDLDTQARRRCDELGLNMIRAETVGTHPAFIRMIRELILERIEPGREKRFLGTLEPAQDTCAAGCCMR
jgi:ferrochelatase